MFKDLKENLSKQLRESMRIMSHQIENINRKSILKIPPNSELNNTLGLKRTIFTRGIKQ